jgi:hypothetical protein
MFRKTGHPSQEDLVRYVGGELSAGRAYRIRQHLMACSACRLRQLNLESTVAELVRLHRTSDDTQLSGSLGLRSRLTAQMDAAVRSTPEPWFRQFAIVPAAQSKVYLCFIFLTTVLGGAALFHYGRITRFSLEPTHLEASLLPNSKLTPGATRSVRLTEICPARDMDLDPQVSPSTQRMVFQKYGIAAASASKYQVDYLINPQLGGTDDIHNLWPEPYGATVWNAHVKDVLEDRLHQMVCDKQIDLTSAQDEIARDWISAYKKYFHTSKPVGDFVTASVEGP